MAPKERQAAPAEEAPEAKKARVDGLAKEKEPVKEKYQEPDAPQDRRPALKEKICFATADTSSNVVPTMGGKVLTYPTDGGMSCVMASARAGVGQKAGRYMFEAKILQVTDPHQGQPASARIAARIGFSTSSSSLMIGEDVSSIYFDAQGFCIAAKKNIKVPASRFGKGQVVAVVLNLDDKSLNFNTIALFRDGVAVGDPVPLPEDLKGKQLFPHLSYCKVSVQVNFGPTALKELPFKCTLLQAAAAADVTVSRFVERASKGGKGRMLKAEMRREKARKGGEARKLKLAAHQGDDPAVVLDITNEEGEPIAPDGGDAQTSNAVPVDPIDLMAHATAEVDQQAAASMHAEPSKSSPLVSMVVCAKAAVMGPAFSPAPPLAEDAGTPFVPMDITDEEFYLPRRWHGTSLDDAAFQAVEDARELEDVAKKAMEGAQAKADELKAAADTAMEEAKVLRFGLGFGVGCVLMHFAFMHFLVGS